MSPIPRGDARRPGAGDASPAARGDGSAPAPGDRPLRFAYADPPYPGLARKYYQHEPTYAGEVDHPALIASLEYSYDGWALSTSARALRQLLPLCPDGVRVCAWVKPKGASPRTFGLHSSWEAVLVKPGRAQRPGVRDWLMAHAARGGGTLPGRKPVAFCAWLFHALGARPGDELADLFPGTGIVGRAWRELGGQLAEPSPLQERQPSLSAAAAVGDASARALGDVFRLELSPLEERRVCAWCRGPIEAWRRRDTRTCSKKCRQTAFRLRRRSVAQDLSPGDGEELSPVDQRQHGSA